MTLTNFQWILTKIGDLHKLLVEISNCISFAKMDDYPKKCEKFHENIAFSLILT